MHSKLLLSLLGLVGVCAAGEWGQLNWLLSKVNVPLGNFSYSNGSIDVAAEGLQLLGVHVDGLSLSTSEAARGTALQLDVGVVVGDITASHFEFKYGMLKGEGSVDIHFAAGLSLGLQFVGSPPTSMEVSKCAARVEEASFYCTGKGILPAGCDLLSAAAPPIAEYLLCGNGTGGLIRKLITKYEDLPGGLTALLRYAASQPPPPPLPVDKSEGRFRNSSDLLHLNTTIIRDLSAVIDQGYGVPDADGVLVAEKAIQALFPGGRGVLDINTLVPINKSVLGVHIDGIEIRNISVSSLELTELNVLEPIGDFTTRNRLNVSGVFKVQLGLLAGDGFSEDISLSFRVKYVAIDLQLLTAMSKTISQLRLGSLLTTPLACLTSFAAPSGLEVTGLGVGWGGLSDVVMDFSLASPPKGAGGGGVNNLVAGVIQALQMLYGEALGSAVPYLVGELATGQLVGRLGVCDGAPPLTETLLAPESSAQPSRGEALVSSRDAKDPPPNADFVDFTTSEFWHVLDSVFNTLLGSVTQPYGINDILGVFAPDGIISMGTGFQVATQGEAFGDFGLSVANTELTGIRNWTGFEMLHPVSPQVLQIALGQAEIGLTTKLDLDWSQVGSVVSDQFSMSVQLERLTLNASLGMEVYRDMILALPLGSLANPGCLLSSMNKLDIASLGIAVGEVKIGINCTACSSPLLPIAAKNLASPSGRAAVTAGVDSLLDMVQRKLSAPQAQAEILRRVQSAECPTPESSKNEEDETPGEVVLYVVVAGGVLSVFLSVVVFTLYKAKKVLAQHERRTDESLFEVLGCEEAMFWHPSTPPALRWSVPLVLVFGIGSLLTANLDPSATYVSTSLGLMGQPVELSHLFDFSLRVAVVEIWNAGLYPLSVAIGLFSGTWAYTKLILLFWTWFVPPTLLSVEKREPILEFLDFFGKYSLVDLYVMAMFAVSFRMHIDLTKATEGVLPPEFLVVDLTVNPGWGLYGYVLAILASVVIGHIEVGRHRVIKALTLKKEPMMIEPRATSPPFSPGTDRPFSPGIDREGGVEANTKGTGSEIKVILDPETERSNFNQVSSEESTSTSSSRFSEPLFSHPFSKSPFPKWMCEEMDPMLGPPLTRLKWWAQGGVVVLLVVAMVGVVIGSFIHSFSFRFEGMAAYGVQITPGQQIYRPYSVASLPMEWMQQASGGAWPGYLFIAACLLLTTVVCPVLQFLALLVLWCTPLTVTQQKVVFRVQKCLAASAATEVFVLALFAAILQLQQFTRFFTKGKCDLINEYMKEGALLGFYSEDQATCFTVISSLEEGCWVLFGASLLSYIVYYIVNNAAKHAIIERESRSGAQ